ncbi:MAG: hypothetical protein HOP29_06565 [Phycisphaerales bacterium]|nr:hypothetical protein [Phycisphaerales bacterium]
MWFTTMSSFRRTVTVLMLLAGTVLAQRRPDAPNVEAPSKPDFLPIYEALGEPRMLIRAVPMEGVLDVTAEAFENRLTTQFRDDRGIVQLIHPDSDQQRNARDTEVLLGNNLDGAARILANRERADVVVLLKLVGLGDRIEASYVIYDAQRGTEMGSHSWSVPILTDGTVDQPTIQTNCDALFIRMTGELAKFSGGEWRHTISIINLPPMLDGELRANLEKMQNVSGKVRVEQDRGHGTSFTSFSLRYANGDELDLRDRALDVLSRMLNDPIQILTTRAGAIVFNVLPPRPAPAQDWLTRTPTPGDDSSGARNERTRFQDAYRKAGQPKTAIVINENAPTSVTGAAQEGQSGATQQGHTGGDGQRTRFELLQSHEIEGQMIKWLNDLGVRNTDIRSAVQQAAKDGNLQLKVFEDYELALLTVDKDLIDLIIVGLGEQIEAGEEYQVRYTFRAYTVKDSRILATSNANASIPIAQKTSNEILSQAVQNIARTAIGDLTVQLGNRWEPPSTILVEVSKVGSHRQLQGIQDWLRSNMSTEIVYILSREFAQLPESQSGKGDFEIVYNTEFDEFMRALHAASAKPDAPFALNGQLVSRQLVRLEATPK